LGGADRARELNSVANPDSIAAVRAAAEEALREALLSEFLSQETGWPPQVKLLVHCERYLVRMFDAEAEGALALPEAEYESFVDRLQDVLPKVFFGGIASPWNRCMEYVMLACVDHGGRSDLTEPDFIKRYLRSDQDCLFVRYCLRQRVDMWCVRRRGHGRLLPDRGAEIMRPEGVTCDERLDKPTTQDRATSGSNGKELQQRRVSDDISPEQDIENVISRSLVSGQHRILHVGLEPELNFGFRKLARKKLETEANALGAYPPDEFRDRLRARVAAITYDCMCLFDRLMQGTATEGGGSGSDSSGPRVPKWIESEIKDALQTKVEELTQQRRVSSANASSTRRQQPAMPPRSPTGTDGSVTEGSPDLTYTQEATPAGTADAETPISEAATVSNGTIIDLWSSDKPQIPRGRSGVGEASTVEPLVKIIDTSLTKSPARKGGRPVILVDGERIKELRGEYSQVVFARFCKVSVDAVQRAEHHGRSSDKTIRRIVRKLRGQGHKIEVKDLIKNPPQ
jgi:hypothetical protein